MKKVFASGTITTKKQGFHSRTRNKDKKPQIGAYQRLSLVRASEASVGDTKGRPLRVGLLQQDARPHPSHRLRPQGLSRKQTKPNSPKGSPFGEFLYLVCFPQMRWCGTKDRCWYDNEHIPRKVFHTSFLACSERKGRSAHCSGKAVFFQPSGGISFDVFPRFPIILLVADDVLIITALP